MALPKYQKSAIPTPIPSLAPPSAVWKQTFHRLNVRKRRQLKFAGPWASIRQKRACPSSLKKCSLSAAARADLVSTAKESPCPPLSNHMDNYTYNAWSEFEQEFVFGHCTQLQHTSKEFIIGGWTVDWIWFFLNKPKTTPKRVFPLLFCKVLTFLNWQVKGHASGEKTADF